jgi:hypothetical protein
MNGIRDWANEGATPEELALLAASRSERPSAAARSQTLAALGLGTTIAATMTTTTSAAATTAGSAFGVVAKLAVVLVVAGGAAGGVAWHETHKAEKVVSAKPTRTVPVPVVAPPAPVTAEPAPDGAPTEEASPPAVHVVPGPSGRPRPAASSDTLSLEVAALEKAHAALAAHDPDAALRALDRYRARFPGGALSSEETVLRVQAAVARGDKRNAAALADKLRADHPDSPYVKRVGDLVSDEKAAKH